MARVSLEEADAIMAQFMGGNQTEESGIATATDCDQDDRQRNFDLVREAKKLRTTSSEVSISGQSDLDTSTISEDTSFRIHRTQVEADASQNPSANPEGMAEGGNERETEQPTCPTSSDGRDSLMEEEPDWDNITQHDPARSEVPVFLAMRERREEANNRFAMALDELHESVSHSMEELLQTVSTLLQTRSEKLFDYEQNLKQDYVYNEKMRASMQLKLEESARAAQGYFANLLLRIAQPDDAGTGSAANSNGGGTGGNQNVEGKSISRDDPCEEEPDWDAIMKHEPAQTEVPKFLEARSRREAAESRFATAIEDYSSLIDSYFQELTQTVADMYNSRSMKLNDYEQTLKQDYVSNNEMRANMQTKLEESATLANNLFQNLMMRVANPQPPPQDVP